MKKPPNWIREREIKDQTRKMEDHLQKGPEDYTGSCESDETNEDNEED